jgi:sugar lactone lactonase YvrE
VLRADRSGSAGAPTVAQPRMSAPPPVLPNLPPPATNPPPPPRRGWLLFGIIGFVVVALCAVIGGAVVLLTRQISTAIPDLPAVVLPTLPSVPDLPDIEATAAALQGTAMAGIPNVGATVESVQETAAAIQTAAAEGFSGLLTPEVDPDVATVELSFGAEGSGPGFLDDPRGVAVGPDGAMYVADYGSGRVQRFSPEGQFERSWVLEDDRPIMALAADREGFVYVSQNFQITKFDGDTGEQVAAFTDSQGDGFEELIVLADGSLLGIPWAESDIVRLSADGEELNRIADPFAAADLEESPGALAADGLGNLYILGDSGENVFLFNPEGRFQDRFSVPDSWSFADLAVDGQGRIYVASFTGGVQIFAADGSPLGRIAVPGVPFDVSFDDQNRLYVVTNSPQVLRLAVVVQ